MKILPKSLTIALSVATTVYLMIGTRGYLSLLSQQPPHKPGAPMPAHITGFPAYVAWIYSILWFLVVFAFTFIIAFTVLKNRHPKRGV
jgi:hypothetical protein